jgi:hypothetical protein
MPLTPKEKPALEPRVGGVLQPSGPDSAAIYPTGSAPKQPKGVSDEFPTITCPEPFDHNVTSDEVFNGGEKETKK